jgi:RNA polymerase sigma-70 factor (ECF subfamily)
VDPDRDDAARLRRGDTAGLTGLMGRHQDRLFRYLLRLLGDEAVAEDVFQQTWLQVTERISRYDAARPFGPRLFTVARNLALDHLRRTRPENLEDVAEPAAPGGGDADPFARAVARQQGARIADAVAGLAPLDREVLSLRFEEDLALPQLAETLGVPVPTAKARLYRALARLRERLLARAPAEEWR